VRRYLEARYFLPATEKTTNEFLPALKENEQINVQHRDMLKDFLISADMVKFAKAESSRGQMEDALIKATEFVNETGEGC